jgi:LysM repeat protein
MAGEEEAAGAGGRGLAATLKHKVGPLPLVVWVGAAIVIWYIVSKRKGSSTVSGQQTDPAGNVGVIDPKTGYVAGSSQDASALGNQNSGTTGSSSGSGSTVAGQYTTNADWARAAINFLVGVGVDPTEANSAVEQYISSQTLTTAQQGEVNLAIQALGAPPDPPNPGTAPPPVVTPPSPGPVYATNPPTGLAVTGSTASTIGLKWNRSTNATGYTITATASGKPTASTTVTGTDASGTVSGLAANTSYTVKVQAQPAKTGAGFASTTASTTMSGGQPPKPTPTPVKPVTPAPPSPAKTTTVTVVKFQGNPPPWNSTLSGIAAHYHTTVAAIMKLNPSIKDANLIHPGDQIKVPTS